MSKQSGIFPFTGKLGNNIGYRRNGNYFIRRMPDNIRQSAATQEAARHFGIASRKGKIIRQAIETHIDVRRDPSLVNRLNKRMMKGDLPAIAGIRWNIHSGAGKFFTYVISGNSIRIPAQILPPQGSNTHLEVKAISIGVNFSQQRVRTSAICTAHIDLSMPFSGITLDTSAPDSGTLLVVLQVSAFKQHIRAEDRRFQAADIIKVAVSAYAKQPPVVNINLPPEIKQVWRLRPRNTAAYYCFKSTFT